MALKLKTVKTLKGKYAQVKRNMCTRYKEHMHTSKGTYAHVKRNICTR